MHCFKCKSTTAPKYIETFADFHSKNVPFKSHLCGSCLVGSMVPVFRESRQRWEFGMIEKYCSDGDSTEKDRANRSKGLIQTSRDEDCIVDDCPQPDVVSVFEAKNPQIRCIVGGGRGGQHCLRFIDDEAEWVTVEASAYADYILHFNKANTKSQLRLDETHECVAYHESNRSTTKEKDRHKVPLEVSTATSFFDHQRFGLSPDVPDVRETATFDNNPWKDVEFVEMKRHNDESDLFESPSREHLSSPVESIEAASPTMFQEEVLDSSIAISRGRGGRTKHLTESSPNTNLVISTAKVMADDDSHKLYPNFTIHTPMSDRSSALSSPSISPTKFQSLGGAFLFQNKINDSAPKYNQRLWTPQEDKILLDAIGDQKVATLKWSVVAKAVPGRSGKQCRERYLNHLTPNIKLSSWSPMEDALIFRLYETEGSKWSMMAKLLRGRTDNGIKNRYHHLKRRLERKVQTTPVSEEWKTLFAKLLHEFRCLSVPRDSNVSGGIGPSHSAPRAFSDSGEESWILKHLAFQLLVRPKPFNGSESASFLRQGSSEPCARCGLIVPSEQTGRRLCRRTGWCEFCIRTSPCASGDMLRACRRLHNAVPPGSFLAHSYG